MSRDRQLPARTWTDEAGTLGFRTFSGNFHRFASLLRQLEQVCRDLLDLDHYRHGYVANLNRHLIARAEERGRIWLILV